MLAVAAGGSALVLSPPGAAGRTCCVLARKRRRGLLLLEEAIFLGAYLGFLVIRACNPEMDRTEKIMDFAFLNAVTRSAHFPPLDPWLDRVAGGPPPHDQLLLLRLPDPRPCCSS